MCLLVDNLLCEVIREVTREVIREGEERLKQNFALLNTNKEEKIIVIYFLLSKFDMLLFVARDWRALYTEKQSNECWL